MPTKQIWELTVSVFEVYRAQNLSITLTIPVKPCVKKDYFFIVLTLAWGAIFSTENFWSQCHKYLSVCYNEIKHSDCILQVTWQVLTHKIVPTASVNWIRTYDCTGDKEILNEGRRRIYILLFLSFCIFLFLLSSKRVLWSRYQLCIRLSSIFSAFANLEAHLGPSFVFSLSIYFHQ